MIPTTTCPGIPTSSCERSHVGGVYRLGDRAWEAQRPKNAGVS